MRVCACGVRCVCVCVCVCACVRAFVSVCKYVCMYVYVHVGVRVRVVVGSGWSSILLSFTLHSKVFFFIFSLRIHIT